MAFVLPSEPSMRSYVYVYMSEHEHCFHANSRRQDGRRKTNPAVMSGHHRQHLAATFLIRDDGASLVLRGRGRKASQSTRQIRVVAKKAPRQSVRSLASVLRRLLIHCAAHCSSVRTKVQTAPDRSQNPFSPLEHAVCSLKCLQGVLATRNS